VIEDQPGNEGRPVLLGKDLERDPDSLRVRVFEGAKQRLKVGQRQVLEPGWVLLRGICQRGAEDVQIVGTQLHRGNNAKY
jgi:hypothetical protein